MEDRKNIFDYIAQIFYTFGFAMLFMMGITYLFGEDAKEVSVFFVFGNKGVPVVVMAEFLLLSAMIVGIRYFFFTDRWIKKMSVLKRTVGMILLVLLVIIVCIVLFDWFPVDMWESWFMFILSFGVCFTASIIISTVKTRMEDRKLAEGLARMKEQWEEKDE